VRLLASFALVVAWTFFPADSPGYAQTNDEAAPLKRNPALARATQTGVADDMLPSPFSPGTSSLETAGAFWLESWNKNLATDRLLGGHVSLGRSWAANWQAVLEIELLRADLSLSRDAFQIGASGLARWRIWSFYRNEVYVEAGLGMTAATAPVPTRGTTFNYLVLGGSGLARPLSDRWWIAGGLRVWHLSNGGTIRGDARNPDIEAIGGYLGLQLHLRN
jgi:Lipid A 3-O-deacylase (PagL)